jgi:hypothetical protein
MACSGSSENTIVDGDERRQPDREDERRAIERRIEEVRARLEQGELDSELAALETALALLDGDRPRV